METKISHTIGKYFLVILLGLSFLIVLISGCNESNDNEPSTNNQTDSQSDNASTDNNAPTIPPKDSMIIAFDDFKMTQTNRFALSENQSENPSISNWSHAALNVGFWNTFITIGLAVPTASFIESFNHTPVEQSDGSWVWSYQVPIGAITYTAKLVGQYVENEVHWDMYITKEGDYSDFNWFSGVADLPGTEVTWILKNNPQTPTDLLKIEWKKDLTDNTAMIQYTNIVPDGPENGGYIKFGSFTDATYNAFYDIYNKSADNLIEIDWHRTSKEGRVKDPTFFDDENWHYWDDHLLDTEELT